MHVCTTIRVHKHSRVWTILVVLARAHAYILYIADLTGNGDAFDVLGALVRVEVQRLVRCE